MGDLGNHISKFFEENSYLKAGMIFVFSGIVSVIGFLSIRCGLGWNISDEILVEVLQLSGWLFYGSFFISLIGASGEGRKMEEVALGNRMARAFVRCFGNENIPMTRADIITKKDIWSDAGYKESSILPSDFVVGSKYQKEENQVLKKNNEGKYILSERGKKIHADIFGEGTNKDKGEKKWCKIGAIFQKFFGCS